MILRSVCWNAAIHAAALQPSGPRLLVLWKRAKLWRAAKLSVTAGVAMQVEKERASRLFICMQLVFERSPDWTISNPAFKINMWGDWDALGWILTEVKLLLRWAFTLRACAAHLPGPIFSVLVTAFHPGPNWAQKSHLGMVRLWLTLVTVPSPAHFTGAMGWVWFQGDALQCPAALHHILCLCFDGHFVNSCVITYLLIKVLFLQSLQVE